MTTFAYWKLTTGGNYGTAVDWSTGHVPNTTVGVTLPELAANFAKYTVTSLGPNAAYGLSIYADATLDIHTGVFTDENYFVSDGAVQIDAGAQFDIGVAGNGQGYGNAGKIFLNGGTIDILDQFLGLNNAGTVLLSNSASNRIVGGTAGHGSTLENSSNTILGAGTIGSAYLTFANARTGAVDASDTIGLTIASGTEATNAGVFESTNTGGLLIKGNIVNDGVLESTKGLLHVTGNVDGYGVAEIFGSGEIEFGGYAYQDLTFEKGAAGTLILDHSSTFPINEIYGATTGDHIDLRDVVDSASVHPTFSLSGTHDEFTLSVTDGMHTSNLYLIGGVDAYTTGSFTLGADGHGGTLVKFGSSQAAG